jgi:hypothetical protein
MSEKFFPCNCGCVVVEIDEDIEQTVFFTLYHRYPKWSFRYRMNAIWHIFELKGYIRYEGRNE